MIIDIFILFIAFGFGLAGWLAPSDKPSWLILSTSIVFSIGLVFEVVKKILDKKESIQKDIQIKTLLDETTKHANLEMFINNKKILDYESAITINTEIDRKFIIKLKNVGNKYANNIQLYLESININLFSEIGRNWIDAGDLEFNVNDNFQMIGMLKNYVFIGPTAIYPNNWMSLGKCHIAAENKNSNFPIHIKIYYDDNLKYEKLINLEIN
jgi:hypothetical protein